MPCWRPWGKAGVSGGEDGRCPGPKTGPNPVRAAARPPARDRDRILVDDNERPRMLGRAATGTLVDNDAPVLEQLATPAPQGSTRSRAPSRHRRGEGALAADRLAREPCRSVVGEEQAGQGAVAVTAAGLGPVESAGLPVNMVSLTALRLERMSLSCSKVMAYISFALSRRSLGFDSVLLSWVGTGSGATKRPPDSNFPAASERMCSTFGVTSIASRAVGAGTWWRSPLQNSDDRFGPPASRNQDPDERLRRDSGGYACC